MPNAQDGEAVSLREYVERMIAELATRSDQKMAEMVIRFDQRAEAAEKAVAAALAGTDKQTAAAFSASERAVGAAFSAAEKAVSQALSASSAAVTKAEIAADKRFEGVNEFRGQLTDQAATFVTRAEWSAAHDALRNELISALKVQNEKIDELRARFDMSTGRSSGSAGSLGNVAMVVGLLIALMMPILMKVWGK